MSVSLTDWTIGHAIGAVFWIWILAFGGAKWVEGGLSVFLVSAWAYRWNAEQIRLYALCILVMQFIWFVAGIFKPEWRL